MRSCSIHKALLKKQRLCDSFPCDCGWGLVEPDDLKGRMQARTQLKESCKRRREWLWQR